MRYFTEEEVRLRGLIWSWCGSHTVSTTADLYKLVDPAKLEVLLAGLDPKPEYPLDAVPASLPPSLQMPPSYPARPPLGSQTA
jgi:hypothetical protein